jgi:peptidyl-prolyl cis-trans isomerase SurA
MFRRLILPIFGLLVFSSSVFGQGERKTLDEIVARVNSDIILRSEYDDTLKVVEAELLQQYQGPQLEEATTDARVHALRDLIDKKLLAQKAEEFGVNADLEVITTMERMRQEYSFGSLEALELAITEQGQNIDDFKASIADQYLTQQILQREVYPKIIITTEDIRTFYDENAEQFDRPEGVRLREIVILTEGKTPEEIEAAEKKIEETLARVRGGEDFPEVASEVSEVPTAGNGGDLGFLEQGSLQTDYKDAAASLERRQISDVIRQSDALVILKVEDKHDGGILPFELAQQDIQDLIWRNRISPRIRAYLDRLRLEGFIDVREGYEDSGRVSETTDSSNSGGR